MLLLAFQGVFCTRQLQSDKHLATRARRCTRLQLLWSNVPVSATRGRRACGGDVVKLYVDGELVVNQLHNRRQSELRGCSRFVGDFISSNYSKRASTAQQYT